MDLGRIELEKGNLNQAKNHLFRAYHNFTSRQNFPGEAAAQVLLAKVYLKEDSIIDARYYLDNALITYQDLNYEEEVVQIYQLLGDSYLQENRYELAIGNYKLSLR